MDSDSIGRRKDLTGQRFGNLLVLGKAAGLQNSYYLWHCRCDCGNEILVNTKNLTGHRTTHCGCRLNEHHKAYQAPIDRSGRKYGALTVLKLTEKSDSRSFLWECECECGNHVIVSATQLHENTVKDCGCGLGNKPKYKDITGQRKGRLTALYPTDKRDGRGSVIWHCRCDCGNEIEMSESNFMFGGSVSCGCVRQQHLDEFLQTDWLTFVDGTCVEWLSNRKNRSDNSSGFRGVYKYSDTRYRVYIGLQGKKYYLGSYKTFDEAVAVRLTVEGYLHDGFVSCFEKWQEKASEDKQWAEHNPFFFNVEKKQRTFLIKSTVTDLEKFTY